MMTGRSRMFFAAVAVSVLAISAPSPGHADAEGGHRGQPSVIGPMLQGMGVGLALVGIGLGERDDGIKFGLLGAAAFSVVLGTALSSYTPPSLEPQILTLSPPIVNTLEMPVVPTTLAMPSESPGVPLTTSPVVTPPVPAPREAATPRWPEMLTSVTGLTVAIRLTDRVVVTLPSKVLGAWNNQAFTLTPGGRQCLAGLAEWWKGNGSDEVRVVVHTHPSQDPRADRERTKIEAAACSAFLTDNGKRPMANLQAVGLGSIEAATEEEGGTPEKNNRVVIELSCVRPAPNEVAVVESLVKSMMGRWERSLERVRIEVQMPLEKASDSRILAAVADALSAASRESGFRISAVEAMQHQAWEEALRKSGLSGETVRWLPAVEGGALLLTIEQAPVP